MKILLVEDEAHLAFNLTLNLREERFDVTVARTIAEAEQGLRTEPDVIVLDLMLPDGSGLDFCSSLRERGIRTPVLMLTAKDSTQSIVEGLGSGADDYVPKPFDLDELIGGRIHALLRRRAWDISPASSQAERLDFGANSIDFSTYTATLGGGETVELTDLEIKLLRYFADNADRVVSRAQLLEDVWQVSPRTNTRTVDNFLVRLRRLFEADAAEPRHFVTVRGVGYRFVTHPAD